MRTIVVTSPYLIVGISPISTKEACLMRNKTPPVPDEEVGYIIQPADFYQLHYLVSFPL